jgi:hypothetical protein
VTAEPLPSFRVVRAPGAPSIAPYRVETVGTLTENDALILMRQLGSSAENAIPHEDQRSDSIVQVLEAVDRIHRCRDRRPGHYVEVCDDCSFTTVVARTLREALYALEDITLGRSLPRRPIDPSKRSLT